MTGPTVRALIDTAGVHPVLALAVVGLVAFTESLAVVGTFVPAAVILFCAGVLVGHGSLPWLPTVSIAFAGAVAGDALSFEAGRHPRLRERMREIANTRAQWLDRAQDLVRRRGAASIFIARFAGALRAFVPLLAGLGAMPRARFYGMNILSALLWAPVHILPGALFGSSLQLAERVSGRIALLLIVLAALLWLAAFSVGLLRRRLAPLAARWRDAAVVFLRRRSSRLARLPLLVLEPAGTGSQGMLAGMGILLAAGWLFFGLLEDVVAKDPLVQADLSVFGFLQQLRTPAADQLMVLVTQAGSVGVMLPLVAVVLAWLLWRRCWRTATYWVGSAAFAELMVQVLKNTLGRQRPLALYDGGEQFSFPSGHATVSVVVLGFLAFLVSRRQSGTWRSGVGMAVTLYVVMVAFSRLYLGAHWFSDVAAGASFGLAWVAFVSMVYTRRAVGEDLAPRKLAAVAGLAIVVMLAGWSRWHGAADQKLYALAPPRPQVLSGADWQREGWRRLPLQRREMAGDEEERFDLQLACSREDALRLLQQVGWQQAPRWNTQSVLLAFASQASQDERPVLPRLDQGRRAVLTFVAPASDQPAMRQVLRLWSSNVEVRDAAGRTHAPVWYGAVYLERRSGALPPRLDAAQPARATAAALARTLVLQGASRLAPGSAGQAALPPLLLSCTTDIAEPARVTPN
ncbi:bifunctional DedA family/phosphatase PAP2 family protein [Ramlibacter sp. AN1133]|uniref:bifunctional DedA family/phosphatase PAP2 family protein n=1 Tax=Ramlibacter sp. AN1133 TaxID=3133429 RepID=UPI0030BE04E5